MEFFRQNGGQSQEFIQYSLTVAPTPANTHLVLEAHSLDAVLAYFSDDSLSSKFRPTHIVQQNDSETNYVAHLDLEPLSFMAFKKQLGVVSKMGWRIIVGQFDFKDFITVRLREKVKGGEMEAVLDYENRGFVERHWPEGVVGGWLDKLKEKFPDANIFRTF